MKFYLMTKIYLYLALILTVTSIWGTGCIADPWPEPDSVERSGGDFEPPYLNDTDAGEGEDVQDTTPGPDVLIDQVYCSAPGETGGVTLVGLAGTFPPASEVVVESETETLVATVGEDGGLAERIAASPGERLRLRIAPRDGPEITQSVYAGTLADDFVGTGILGEAAPETPAAGVAEIYGDGIALEEGVFVVGANLDRPTGRLAPVSCNAGGCMFGMLIPGEPGDEVDLFLVSQDSRAGLSDVQTVILP